MKKIVLATGNKNKVKEIQALVEQLGLALEIISAPESFDPEETGKTFEENALIKAKEAAKLLNLPALADDSGLEIDALQGAPGIYSSRYAETNDGRIDRVIKELKNVSQDEKTARFTCSMVFVDGNGKTLKTCKGHCEGMIIDERRGSQGFGYDPIFFIPELNKTLAQIPMNEKNKISHRSNALKCMIEWLKENFI